MRSATRAARGKQTIELAKSNSCCSARRLRQELLARPWPDAQSCPRSHRRAKAADRGRLLWARMCEHLLQAHQAQTKSEEGRDRDRYIDEIDKVARKARATRDPRADVSGEGLQQALPITDPRMDHGLRHRPGWRKPPQQEFIQIRHTNVLLSSVVRFDGRTNQSSNRTGREGNRFGATIASKREVDSRSSS